MHLTYPSATVEDPTTKKRYVFCTATLDDDGIVINDKRSGQILAEIKVEQLSAPPPKSNNVWANYAQGVRVKEHCSPCTRARSTRVEDML